MNLKKNVKKKNGREKCFYSAAHPVTFPKFILTAVGQLSGRKLIFIFDVWHLLESRIASSALYEYSLSSTLIT